ncbi:MAG: hypothetical protein ABIG39_07660 [Candidatus Micrarchaeota archaeon]
MRKMDTKTIGAGLVSIGILCLIGYWLYVVLEAADVPLFVKMGIALVIVGAAVLIPALLKEAKKDKVIVK